MDFVEGLPKSEGKEIILWLLTDSPSMHILSPYHIQSMHPRLLTPFQLIFTSYMGCLALLTDRDKIFTSNFWQHLFKALGVTLKLSTTYHPQTGRQTERVNQCLENYLRYMTRSQPKKWVVWMPLANWGYNTNFHTSLGMTPYQALYGVPPTHYSIDRVHTPNEAVAELLKDHCTTINFLKEKGNLPRSSIYPGPSQEGQFPSFSP